MGGPTGHGQKNKAHKAGRAAGLSARQKHKQGKEAGQQRQPAKSGVQGGKVERLAAAKQHRDAKRQELLDSKRRGGAPLVVALLPLSAAVDVAQLWSTLIASCSQEPSLGDGKHEDAASTMDLELEGAPSTSGASSASPLSLTTVTVAGGRGRGVRLTLLPPPSNRGDLLSVVDVGRAAEVLLVAVPGGEQAEGVDEAGKSALSVLRALGLPSIVVAVQGSGAGGSGPGSMKERSAAKKRAEKAVTAQVAGDHKYFHVDSRADCQQLLRHVTEHAVSVPVWRRQRPSLLVEAAEFRPQPQEEQEAAGTSGSQAGGQPTGTLLLTGYVRSAGLSANQLIHIPGAGDFQIDCIEGAAAPGPGSAAGGVGGGGAARSRRQSGAGQGGAAADMDTSGSGPTLLAKHDPEERETLTRENVPDPTEGEQTWPSEQELLDVERLVKGKERRRRLPAGTSEYQAAWILDDDEEDEDGDEEEDEEGDAAMASGAVTREGSEGEAPELGDLADDEDGEDDGTDGMALDEEDAEKAAALHEELRSRHRQRQEQEQEQEQFPDEVEVPADVPARTRFQKYRGLKSFRSSPWDVKEWLPSEYARIFAFENFKRAHKRAKAAAQRATADLDPCAVAPGAMVTVHVTGVPADTAAGIVRRVALYTAPCASSSSAEAAAPAAASAAAPPLVAFGLLMHEAKLSVLHLGVKKTATHSEPIVNKEELLIVTGVRTFPARPIFSADTPGDKQKMERYLHAGRHTIASVYAPISYAPLPVLAFKLPEQQQQAEQQQHALPSYQGAVLAATGAVRSCDPDRIVLKKITLTGYPVRVHKKRATVRFMFHTPDDIRWFRPVELYTKYGRRGRILEPLGTHGAMKCLFDAPVQQRDAVCMSLYKRAFPKWPASLAFT